MKRILFFSLLLTSCINDQPIPAVCEEVNFSGLEKYEVYEGDYWCFPENIVKEFKNEHYSVKDENAFIVYALKNGGYRTTNNEGYLYYADKQGNRIPNSKTIHVFDTNKFIEFSNRKSSEDLKKRLKDEEDAEVKRLETKYNLKFCTSRSDVNCLIRIPFGRYSFLQHIPEGTLITTSQYALNGTFVGPNYLIGSDLYLIVGGTESSLREHSFVREGEFKVLGTFPYKSILGVDKQAVKIQRLN